MPNTASSIRPARSRRAPIPATTRTIPSPQVWNLIVTNDKMSNEDAYTIVKTLVEKKADIVAVHKESRELFARQPGAGAFRRSRSIPAR